MNLLMNPNEQSEGKGKPPSLASEEYEFYTKARRCQTIFISGHPPHVRPHTKTLSPQALNAEPKNYNQWRTFEAR